jgi:hypothetical protein
MSEGAENIRKCLIRITILTGKDIFKALNVTHPPKKEKFRPQPRVGAGNYALSIHSPYVELAPVIKKLANLSVQISINFWL